MSEETQTNTASQANDTNGDAIDPALASFMASKGVQPPGWKPPPVQLMDGNAPDMPQGMPQADASPPETSPEAPKQEPPPAAKKPEPDAKSLMAKYAAKDAAFQQERAARARIEQELQQLRAAQEEEARMWDQDPLAALHRRKLTTRELNQRALELGEKPVADSADKPQGKTADPVISALEQRLAEIERRDQENQRRLQQYEQEKAVQHQVDVLKNHLGSIEDFPLLNDLGEHRTVYDAVVQHLAGGQFADDEEAAAVISNIAHQHEARLQARLREQLGKPKFRAFLERELRGAQKEASPARQVNQGEPRASNPARSAFNPDSALTRSSVPPTNLSQAWDRDAAWRQTMEEASKLALPG